MALPSPNSAHRDKPTSAKCPRYRAVLNDIRLLTRETDSTGWGRRNSNLCILESEFAKTLSPGDRTRMAHLVIKGARAAPD
jgi:hypothetical protein